MKTILKKIELLKEKFALLSVFQQLVIVFLFAFFIIFFASFIIGSLKITYSIFVNPVYLTKVDGSIKVIFFAFFITLVGIITTSFIISVLSSFLSNFLKEMRKGKLSFEAKDFTFIVNYNSKIFEILKEYDKIYNNHIVLIFIEKEEEVEKLYYKIRQLKLKNIKVFVRSGSALDYNRYKELSILKAKSLIILLDEKTAYKEDKNLQILNILCNQEDFNKYLDEKRAKDDPLKFVVEFKNIKDIENNIKLISSNQAFPIAIEDLLEEILKLSILDIRYYFIYSALFSFKGHDFEFVSAKKYDFVGKSFQEAYLSLDNSSLIAISRKIGNSYKLIMKKDEIIEENDFLVILTSGEIKVKKKDIKYSDLKLNFEELNKNFVILGNFKKIPFKTLDISLDEINKAFWKKYDKYLINLDSIKAYRLAIKVYDLPYKDKIIFILEDSLKSKLIQSLGYKCITLNILDAKYIARISTKISLHNLFKIFISKIDFVNIDGIENLDELKLFLIENNMIFLGIITKDNQIRFNSIENVDKVIVIKGE